MKAVINEKETPVVKSKYPYLGQTTNCHGNKCVVLFTGIDTGFVVYSEDFTVWPIGDNCSAWAEQHLFTPFTGSITLSND